MLRAGHDGHFAPLVALVTNADGSFNNTFFFWLTGMLSAFLDNAPTYLAFFNLAGGDPTVLMGEGAKTLMAISMGSVFMGAVTYIGPELHDGLHLQRARHQDADVLRLHALVGDAPLPDLLPDGHALPHLRAVLTKTG